MNSTIVCIFTHQIIFQGMFFTKNLLLRRKLGMPVRGRNRAVNYSIRFFAAYIIVSVLLGFFETPFGAVNLVSNTVALGLAIALLAINLLVGVSSLVALKDSWRIGVLDNQQTDLVEKGIYRFSRNPYFLSYLIMFTAYTILLQSIILLILSLIGFVLIHAMVLKEEKHLITQHGDIYRHYQERVPRYILF